MQGQEQEKNQQECWGLQDGKCYWGILASDGPSGHCTLTVGGEADRAGDCTLGTASGSRNRVFQVVGSSVLAAVMTGPPQPQ